VCQLFSQAEQAVIKQGLHHAQGLFLSGNKKITKVCYEKNL